MRIISSAVFVHDHLITKVVVEKFNKIFEQKILKN